MSASGEIGLEFEMDEQKRDTSRRTYVMIADLKDKSVNSEDLDDWLQDGWKIVSVRIADHAEQSIVILITVESSIGPMRKATFRPIGDRRSHKGLPH